MALTSRITGLFGRVWNSLGSTPEFEGDEGVGLWMSAGDAQLSLDSAGAPPPLEFRLPSRPTPPPASEAAIGSDEQPEAPVIAFPTRREAVAATAPEPEPVAIQPEPTAVGPAPTTEAPAEATALFEASAAPTASVAASDAASGDDALGDALSMFREVAASSDSQHLTKDIEDVPIQELLADARAVLDMLGGPVASTE